MFNNILIVCVGNICRSPSAERILQHMLPDKNITSAGLGALVDHGIEENAAALLDAAGYDSANHKARQISNEIVSNADLILVMEQRHLKTIREKYPAASGKTMLLGKWVGDKEIPDPYKRSEEVFSLVYELIGDSCKQWGAKLS
ncbi:low molecular weight phosphotyrosine protein phosphatase [Thalassotalea litorea]|uniref:protein-tyrosine-phosphatase n=1 Tax=Thalassotalea litorea TaxID=2020715 RepID=A0A5R9IPA9_9GAMM|nr:low molecular weight protein-tyrosine-phosphatase [Thalassotalea litorea]TLU65091.1 low molecular weight phosphotyrosine protein phosphatase [Thalassotalea litorea]